LFLGPIRQVAIVGCLFRPLFLLLVPAAFTGPFCVALLCCAALPAVTLISHLSLAPPPHPQPLASLSHLLASCLLCRPLLASASPLSPLACHLSPLRLSPCLAFIASHLSHLASWRSPLAALLSYSSRPKPLTPHRSLSSPLASRRSPLASPRAADPNTVPFGIDSLDGSLHDICADVYSIATPGVLASSVLTADTPSLRIRVPAPGCACAIQTGLV